MAPSPSVVIVGSLMQDLTFACAEFPRSGQTIVGRLSTGQGGKGSNQAIACGRTGVPTVFIGAAGRDGYADRVEAFYRRERIGCRLARKPGVATGTAVILLDRSGQNEIVIEPGANAQLAPRDVPAGLLRAARVVVVQLEANLATTAAVLRRARRAGATTVLNPAPMRPDFDPALLRDTDILVPNETEFVALVRGLPGLARPRFSEGELRRMRPDALHALCREFGVPTLIVTLGERGSFVSQESGWRHLPARRVTRVVDTTGAGDAFCGGLAAGLVRTGDVVAAAEFGTTVAALSITKPGAAGAMPTRAEIDRFLRRKSAR